MHEIQQNTTKVQERYKILVKIHEKYNKSIRKVQNMRQYTRKVHQKYKITHDIHEKYNKSTRKVQNYT